MSVTVEVKGLRELNSALHQLPDRVNRRVLRASVAPAADLIRKEAQRRAPVDTGRLEQSIIIKRVTGERAELATYIVVPLHGKKAQQTKKWGTAVDLDAYYWTFIEFGTAKMHAQPFMRPAFESLKGTALDVIVDSLKIGVDREAAQLAWRT